MHSGTLCLFLACHGGIAFLTAEGREVVTATVTGIHERASAIFCSCNNIEGRDLVFDLVVENRGEVSLRLYAFVWASNDNLNPPERGLWPLSAVETALDESGSLVVRDHTQGKLLEVEPRSVVQLSQNFILQPIGWWEGEPIRFRQLRAQLWSQTGTLLFDHSFEIPRKLASAKEM